MTNINLIETERTSTHINAKMDYMVIGSCGFAQLRDAEYYEKMKFENKFIFKLISEFIKDKHSPIPLKIQSQAFSHDFGTYQEWCIMWNLKDMYDLEDNHPEKHDELWELLNEFEGINIIGLEEEIINAWADKNIPVIQLKVA